MPNLKDLERQSGLLRLISYLYDGDSYVVKLLQEHDIPNNQLIRSITRLIKLGIITSMIDDSNFPKRKILSLTEKGNKIAKRLKEIEQIMAQ